MLLVSYAAAEMKNVNNISTVVELDKAVKSNTIEHTLKEMAQLILVAMNDWPTPDQTSINDFILEYNKFVQEELLYETKIDLSLKHNAWKLEAHESIKQLQDRAKNIGIVWEAEEAVNKILDFYSQRNQIIIIDGNRFNELQGFYDNVEKQLARGDCPWGRNLDSLDEIVSENLTTPRIINMK